MKLFKTILFILLLTGLSVGYAEVSVAGKVAHVKGTLVAQRVDGTVNVLAEKSEVLAGDMLITAKDSYAEIIMNDGAQLTLRPHSNLRVEAFHFDQVSPQSDNMALRLLKGGFRTLSGLIGKRGNTGDFKLQAATANIGIRGTDFSTRLCGTQNCQDEGDANKAQGKSRTLESSVVGRVMLVQGQFSAKQEDGKSRALIQGAPVYEGDVLITGASSNGLVGFRDESRISLQANTQFLVEKFKYDKDKGEENSALRLLKGGVRVFSGWIGRVVHENFQFRVATATIGIRGTGFDAWCNGPCASDDQHPGGSPELPLEGAGVYVWAGEVALMTGCDQAATCATQIVGLQQSAIISRDTGKPMPLPVVPQNIIDNPAPRPDVLPIDLHEMFGSEFSGNPGVYLTVHSGEVSMAQDGRVLILNQGETGYGGAEGLLRLNLTPGFMGDDMNVNFNGIGNNMNNGGCMIH